MAGRPKRHHVPVRKYGFTEDSEDDVTDGESDYLHSDASISEDSETSDNSDSDDNAPDVPVSASSAQWTFVTPETDPGPPDLAFNSQEGWSPTVTNPDEMQAVDFVSMYLSDHIFELLVTWTNKRAEIAKEDLGEGNELHWKDVTVPEMKTFIGLTFCTGLIRKPELRDYWSTELLMSTPYFGHQNSLSRNRYLMILKFIRFSDPEAAIPNDKMSRIQEFIDCIHEICKQWNPEQDLSIDETLLLFKGRLSCRQFIRIKRARFGIKSYVLTDASGYMLYFHPYVGAATDLKVEDESGVEQFELSKSERVVVFLLEKAGLLDTGHVVSCDNWYCSVRLSEYLFSRSTGIRGTIRVNRGVPGELSRSVVERGSTKFARRGATLCMKYADKKDVFLISTVEAAGFVEKTQNLPGNKRCAVQKPVTVCNYNLKMNGVDLIDQLLAPYDCTRRSHAWFKKVGFNVLQRMLINAFVRFNHKPGNNMRLKSFIKLSIGHFTRIPSEPAKPGTSSGRRSCDSKTVPATLHKLTRIPESERKKYPTKPCRICSKDKRKESRYQCLGCVGEPGLCINGDCFDLFHK